MLVGRRCGCDCVGAGDGGWQWLGVLELVWWFTVDGECGTVGEGVLLWVKASISVWFLDFAVMYCRL